MTVVGCAPRPGLRDSRQSARSREIAIVAASFVGTAIYVILAAAGLEFLGLGDVTVIDWGTMFYWAQNNDALLLGAWWWYVAPARGDQANQAYLALPRFS